MALEAGRGPPMEDVERGLAFSSRDVELGENRSGLVLWKLWIYAVLH
jgi:hypothetical protein